VRLDSRTAVYCHEFLHKKYAPNSFPELKQDEPNEVVEEFKKQGFVHENKVIKALTEAIPGLIVIDQSRSASDAMAPAKLREEAIAWLDSYNRDDVRATFAVRAYIRGILHRSILDDSNHLL
jgi:hypothetical protein